MSTVAIIQARMNSTRLPGKVMLPLGDSTVLKTVVDRVRAANRVDKVVVATSMATADTAIERFCLRERVCCHRGSEDDVLDRVYQAARAHNAEHVVDITADCPLVDPRHIDRLVGELLGGARGLQSRTRADNGSPDYVSNCVERDWPDGLDIQCYTIEALRLAWQSADSVREHVGWNIPRIAEAHELFIRQPMAPARYRHPEWGLTLDEPQDYELLKRLFQDAMLTVGGSPLFPVEHALEFLIAHPEYLRVNAGVARHARSNDKAGRLIEEVGRG